ncbi:hypothetical protein [Proteus columbae]|uniref:hypothetical protein n=1 Tax=Proteus columbae TaxID=1987580 RepID=UPI00288A38E5|nr:hypothetical protein [Proteus columbae]
MSTFYSLLTTYLIIQICLDKYFLKHSGAFNIIKFIKFTLIMFLKEISNFLLRIFLLNDNNLAKQPIFWIGTITPLIIAIWVEYNILSLNKQLLSIKMASELIKESVLPIYISALTPTLGVFISNIHRTIQTKTQINKIESQIIENIKKNTSDGFYSHIKYITEEFSKIKIKIKIHEIPIHFLSFYIPYHKDYLSYNSFQEKACNNININLTIKSPKSLYHHIYEHSNMYQGVNYKEINIEFIEKINFIIDNMLYMSSEFRTSLIIDNAGNAFDIQYIKKNQQRINHISQSLNVDKMNSLFYFDVFDIKNIEPNIISNIINTLINLETKKIFRPEEKAEIKALQQKYLSKALEYYGKIILNYIDFIMRIMEVIERDDDSILEKSNKIRENARRMIDASNSLSYVLNIQNYISEYFKK